MPFSRLFDMRHGPFVELQREINTLFDSLVSRRFGVSRGLFPRAFPPTNIYEDADAVRVESEMAGVDQDSLELFVTGDVLTIKGEVPALEADETTTVHIRERGCGRFNRAIALPTDVKSDEIEAHYANGVLRVKLPKAPEAQPKHVNVNVE